MRKEGSQFALTRSFLVFEVQNAAGFRTLYILSAEGRELGHGSQELIISVVCVEHEDGVPVFLREYLINQLDIWEGEGIRYIFNKSHLGGLNPTIRVRIGEGNIDGAI